MSTLVTHLAIPSKPTKSLSSFNKKKSKLFVASSSQFANGMIIVRPCSLQCNAQVYDPSPTANRRSGNYKPPIWDFDFIQSLTIKYTEEGYLRRANELIEQVKMLLVEEQTVEYIRQLELIDDLHRLGISYHFDDQINEILKSLYHRQHNGNNNGYHQRDLYSTSLGFRLLRQYGFNVSQDVFDCFKNESGDFKASLGDDTKGLLQLYEASFMMTRGENTLELAREFSTNLLQKKLDHRNHDAHDDDDDHVLLLMVGRALELPIHWRIQRPNARWFIEEDYGKRPNMNPILLELAKLDFNIVQATHQQELKHVSSWWETSSIAKLLPFARDRVVENYLWTAAAFDPQYGYPRIMAAKVNALITVIDDVFDVYGTLEELQLFNDIIQRWDIEAMDKLPHYMQICFLALNNFVDELAYNVLKQQGLFHIIPYLRKSWADLCKSYMQEAEWYYAGYTPTMEEYIENAWISISAPVIVSHAYFLVANPIDNEAIRSLYKYHNIVRCSSMILRLANDLGTSPDEMSRGDVPKLTQCYMSKTGANWEEAREYVMSVMRETWKKTNEELLGLEEVGDDAALPENVVKIAVGYGRMAQYMYHKGDGHGIQSPEMKDRISSLLFEPFLL